MARKITGKGLGFQKRARLSRGAQALKKSTILRTKKRPPTLRRGTQMLRPTPPTKSSLMIRQTTITSPKKLPARNLGFQQRAKDWRQAQVQRVAPVRVVRTQPRLFGQQITEPSKKAWSTINVEGGAHYSVPIHGVTRIYNEREFRGLPSQRISSLPPQQYIKETGFIPRSQGVYAKLSPKGNVGDQVYIREGFQPTGKMAQSAVKMIDTNVVGVWPDTGNREYSLRGDIQSGQMKGATRSDVYIPSTRSSSLISPQQRPDYFYQELGRKYAVESEKKVPFFTKAKSNTKKVMTTIFGDPSNYASNRKKVMDLLFKR